MDLGFKLQFTGGNLNTGFQMQFTGQAGLHDLDLGLVLLDQLARHRTRDDQLSASDFVEC